MTLTPKQTRKLIKEAYEGDVEAINEIHGAMCLLSGMSVLSGHDHTRNSLMLIAKHFFGCTIEEVMEIFSVSKGTASEITSLKHRKGNNE